MKIKFLTIAAIAFSTLSATAQITVKTDAGDLKMRFIGRTNFDIGTYLAKPDGTDEHNGIAMNDTRLGVSATFDEKFSSKIEICYASKAISFRDLWIGYKINDNSSLTVGNHFQPFGAKPLGLSYKFVEDASADYAICPARKIGFSYAYTSDPFNFTAGIFSDGNVDNGKNVDAGFSLAAKAIWRPVVNDQTILHIGAAPMFTKSPNNVSFTGILPTTVLKNNALIKTPSWKHESTTRYEVEAIFTHGKFYAEAHYLGASVKSDDDAVEDSNIKGFYAQTSWMIIGEKQNYNKKTGLAATASPKSLEILARISTLDLDDLECGKQTDFTLGLNYFFNKNLNVKFNYIYGSVKDGDDCHFAQTRLQFSF
ncbi:MAG: hypothetical protein J6Y82_07175 [Bacteroidales bacterium]|nr:hypothetical protein [Bacteroidales bacterium]